MMAVTSVKIEDTSCTVDTDYYFTYKTLYHVVVSDPLDGPDQVGNASFGGVSIPEYGDSYSVGNSVNLDAFAVSATIGRMAKDDTHLHWLVEVTHSTKTRNSRDTSSAAGNPLSEGGQWKISGSFQKGTKTVEIDSQNRVIMNTSFERRPYDIPYGHDTLILDGNTATISLLKRAKAMFKTNKSTIWGLPAHSILLVQWSYDILYYGRTPYVHNHLEFEINHDVDHAGDFIGWDIELRNWGSRQYLGVLPSGKPKFAPLTANDLPIAEGDLDLNGVQLAAGLPPYYLLYTPIREYEYTLLGLPSTLPPSAVFV